MRCGPLCTGGSRLCGCGLLGVSPLAEITATAPVTAGPDRPLGVRAPRESGGGIAAEEGLSPAEAFCGQLTNRRLPITFRPTRGDLRRWPGAPRRLVRPAAARARA